MLKVKSNINGNSFFMQNRKRISLYDLNFKCLKYFDINHNFLDFGCFTDNEIDVFIIQFENKILCYKMEGLNIEIKNEIENCPKNKQIKTFNSILDYYKKKKKISSCKKKIWR